MAYLLCTAGSALAYSCLGSGYAPGSVTFVPATPTSSDTLHAVYNAGKFVVTSHDVKVAGNAIAIVRYGYPPTIFGPFEECVEFDLGPLAAETYGVNLQTGGITAAYPPTQPPTQIGTLVVKAAAGPGTSAFAIPTLGPVALLTLAGSIALVAVPLLSRVKSR